MLASPQMKDIVTNCDIIKDHNIDTDHNWVTATLKVNSQITNVNYLKVDKGSNTRIYKDKNLSLEIKKKFTEKLARKWPQYN